MRNKTIIAISAILSIGAFFILPVYDDFYYLSSPHKMMDVESFLPNGSFWRPIDALWGIMMGKYVDAFPFLNHLLVLICFAYSSFGLIKILNYSNVKGYTKSIAIAIFMLSPALVATTYSIDSINQALCLAFGISSLLLYKHHKFWTYVFITLSLFSKESGIAWFAVTPLLSLVIEKCHNNKDYINKKDYTSLIKPYCISIVIILIYACIRIYLNVPSDSIENGYSRYTPQLGLNCIAGLCMIVGSAISVIDTIALFIEHNYIIVFTTALISVIFIFIIIKKTVKKENLRIFIPLVLSIIAITSPHLIMEHPGEMHVYPSLWIIALSIGILTKEANWGKKELALIALTFLFGIFVFIHKGYYIYKNGRIANERVSSAVSQSKNIPNKVCILDCDNQIPIYSVFQTNGRNCWYSGKGTRLYFDLENPQIVSYHIIKIEDLKRHLHIYTHKDSTYNAIWIVKDNHVRVISIKTYSGKTHTRKQRR